MLEPLLGPAWAIVVLLIIIVTRFNVWLQTQVWRVIPRNWEATSVIVYAVPFAVVIFVGALPAMFLTRGDVALGPWLLSLPGPLLVSIVEAVVLYSLLYLIIRLTGKWWWFGVTGLMLAVIAAFELVNPAYIAPLRMEPVDAPVAELESQSVYVAEELPVHAYVAGIGARPVVVVHRPVLEWEPRELEFLLAHEMGHYRRAHFWWRLLQSLIVISIGMFIVDKTLGFALKRWPRLGVESLAVPASLPLIIVVFSTWSLLISPATRTVSRLQEHSADQYAVGLTSTEALRIHAEREAERLGEPDEIPALVEILLRDKPSSNSRIARSKKLSQR